MGIAVRFQSPTKLKGTAVSMPQAAFMLRMTAIPKKETMPTATPI